MIFSPLLGSPVLSVGWDQIFDRSRMWEWREKGENPSMVRVEKHSSAFHPRLGCSASTWPPINETRGGKKEPKYTILIQFPLLIISHFLGKSRIGESPEREGGREDCGTKHLFNLPLSIGSHSGWRRYSLGLLITSKTQPGRIRLILSTCSVGQPGIYLLGARKRGWETKRRTEGQRDRIKLQQAPPFIQIFGTYFTNCCELCLLVFPNHLWSFYLCLPNSSHKITNYKKNRAEK